MAVSPMGRGEYAEPDGRFWQVLSCSTGSRRAQIIRICGMSPAFDPRLRFNPHSSGLSTLTSISEPSHIECLQRPNASGCRRPAY